MADPQLDHHRRNNLATADAFEPFRSHRERVTAEILALPGSSVAIWGAGNGNDLDLPVIRGRFERIVLLDIDLQSMAAGVERQLGDRDTPFELVEADAVAWGASPPQELPTCDVVVSVGLLSQLLHFHQSASDNESPDAVWPCLERIRREHVVLLARMANASGSVLLFNDFLSSDTCPELATCTEPELPQLARREISRSNFFTGMNPAAIDRLIKTTPEISYLVTASDPSLPWRWNLGANRFYAVCVHRMRRSAGEV